MNRNKRMVFIPAVWMIRIGLIFLIFTSVAQAQSGRFLPFQGRLTDPDGKTVSDGSYKIQFKIFDDPMEGTALWDGEIHITTVSGGLVSVILGTKNPFGDSFPFNQTLYLEITVDVNGDSVINDSDPPMLPRQRILPAIFAGETGKLEGRQWKDFFTVPPGAPGDADPAKNSTNAIVKDADLFDGIDSADVFVNPLNVESPKVKKAALADFATSVPKGLNYDEAILEDGYAEIIGTGQPGWFDLEGLSVNFTSHGRPVLIQLFVATDEQQVVGPGHIAVVRDETDVAEMINGWGYPSDATFKLICIDFPPPGQHTYKVKALANADRMYLKGHSTGFNEYKMVIYEF